MIRNKIYIISLTFALFIFGYNEYFYNKFYASDGVEIVVDNPDRIDVKMFGLPSNEYFYDVLRSDMLKNFKWEGKDTKEYLIQSQPCCGLIYIADLNEGLYQLEIVNNRLSLREGIVKMKQSELAYMSRGIMMYSLVQLLKIFLLVFLCYKAIIERYNKYMSIISVGVSAFFAINISILSINNLYWVLNLL